MKYRKKPVVIEALQFDGSGKSVAHISYHFGADDLKWDVVNKQLRVQTLEGTLTADVGDWIIRGIKGELYPCKPDIFEATYERVDDAHR